jgi:hypothetical protein
MVGAWPKPPNYSTAPPFSPKETYPKIRQSSLDCSRTVWPAPCRTHDRPSKSSLLTAISAAASENRCVASGHPRCGRSIRFGRELSKGVLSSIERAPLRQRDLNHPVKRIGSPTVLNVEEVVAQC